jgi:DNA-binding transcriptional LysR family regulator
VELRDIEIFLTLAEELHFGRTAERLCVTPARVSQAIKKQERAIGAALFERTSRVVRLTPTGERLRDDLEPGYRQIRQAISGAAAAVRGIGGTVRVGFSGPWCGDLIIKATEVFRDRYPACAVKVVERMLADRFAALRAGEIDLQLAEFPADEPDIATGPILFREQRALQVPLGHPLAARKSVTLEDYGNCEVITIENVPDYFLDYHVPRRTPSGRPVRRGPKAASFQEVQSMIAAGKGVQPPVLARGGLPRSTGHRHHPLRRRSADRIRLHLARRRRHRENPGVHPHSSRRRRTRRMRRARPAGNLSRTMRVCGTGSAITITPIASAQSSPHGSG